MADPLQITVPAVGYQDPEVDDWIAAQLARQNAPAGSVQETINQRFPKLGWNDQAEMAPGMNAIPETDDEAYSGMDTVGLQHYWRDLPKLTNEAGAAAWMKDPNPSGGFSGNIDDRRNQSSLEAALGMLQTTMGDEDLSQLTPQEYINRVIGGMHNNDFYYGPGAENYHLVEGMAPRNFDQADFYPTRKVSR